MLLNVLSRAPSELGARILTFDCWFLARPDDHPLCLKNVRSWIKSTKEQITALRGEVRRDVKGSKAKLHSKEGYVRNMQHYLKHGDWIDNFYGEYEEKKVQWVTIKPSGVM